MRRSLLLPVTLTLALVTATALLGAATLLTEPPPTARAAPIVTTATTDDDTPLAHANIALIGRFYAAVNRAVWTGDPSALDRVVAPDLVDHAGRPGAAGTRADLYQRLSDLHATLPALQLTATDLRAEGDLVVAHVAVAGAERRVFAGVPPAPDPGAWGALDLFRIAHGRIVERWGDPGGTSPLQPLLHAPLTVPRAEAVHVRLERLTIPPGAGVRQGPGPIARAIVVEAGDLRVSLDGEAGEPASPSPRDASPVPLAGPMEAGDAQVLPRGAAAELHNAGAVSTVALVATVEVSMMPGATSGAPQATGSGPLRSLDGASSQVLARGTFTLPPDVARSLGLARIELEPGGELLVPAATNPTLFVVETGLAVLTRDPADRPPVGSEDETSLAPGAAIATVPGAPTTLRNPGARPLVLLVATLGPTAQTTATPSST